MDPILLSQALSIYTVPITALVLVLLWLRLARSISGRNGASAVILTFILGASISAIVCFLIEYVAGKQLNQPGPSRPDFAIWFLVTMGGIFIGFVILFMVDVCVRTKVNIRLIMLALVIIGVVGQYLYVRSGSFVPGLIATVSVGVFFGSIMYFSLTAGAWRHLVIDAFRADSRW